MTDTIPPHPLRSAKIRVFREVIDGGKTGLKSFRAVIGADGWCPTYFTGTTYQAARDAAEAWRRKQLAKHEAGYIRRQEAAAKARSAKRAKEAVE